MARLALIFFLYLFGPVVSADTAGIGVPPDERPVLRTGFVEFPPFKYADENGNASGPWVEMTEQVAAEAGYRVQWVHLPIARVYMYLKDGTIDLWPGGAGIPALSGHVYESVVTPMRLALYAYHLRDAEPPDSLDFLVGKPLILITGFSYLGHLENLPLKDRNLIYARNHRAALRMLEIRRGRYLLDYDEPVAAIKGDFPGLDLTGTRILEVRGAFVVSKLLPDASQVLQQLEGAYLQLEQQGQLQMLQ